MHVQLLSRACARPGTLLNARPLIEHYDRLHGWRSLAPPSSPPGRTWRSSYTQLADHSMTVQGVDDANYFLVTCSLSGDVVTKWW
ncbi:hypothetical protein [Nocardia xishanensis]